MIAPETRNRAFIISAYRRPDGYQERLKFLARHQLDYNVNH